MIRNLVGRVVRARRARVFMALLPVMLALTIGAGAALAVVSAEDATTRPDASTTSGFHSYATIGQLVVAWGDNEFGQLGNGASGSGANKPVGVGGRLSAPDIKTLAGGANHSLALKTDGTVWAWGRNNVGELGNGTNSTTGCNCISTPVQVVNPSDPSGFLQGVTTIAAGGDHSLALRSDGTVLAWGSNNFGQLGNGDNILSDRNTPVKVSNLSGVRGIAAGGSHSLAK